MAEPARPPCLLISLLLAGCGAAPSPPAKPAAALPVETATVAERPLVHEVRAGGTLRPAEVVQVCSRVAGVVDSIAVRAGDAVAAGQMLAAIDAKRFAIAVQRAEATLRKAEAQVEEARASLVRRESLDAQGSGMVQAEEMVTWRCRLAQAEADAGLARAGLAQARLDAEEAVIRAPLAGVVESRPISPGQWLAPGTVVATQVRRLPLRLSARVATAEAGLLAVGQEARVHAGGAVLDARLVLIGADADPATRTVEVVAEVAEAPPTVVAGCFAELVAAGGPPRPRPVVPQAALRAGERGYTGFVVVADGGRSVARARVVRTGLRGADGAVEVIDGLAAGERLVVNGADSLRDGQAVEARQAAP